MTTEIKPLTGDILKQIAPLVRANDNIKKKIDKLQKESEALQFQITQLIASGDNGLNGQTN